MTGLVYFCLLSELPEDWLKGHETLCSSGEINSIFSLKWKFLSETGHFLSKITKGGQKLIFFGRSNAFFKKLITKNGNF